MAICNAIEIEVKCDITELNEAMRKLEKLYLLFQCEYCGQLRTEAECHRCGAPFTYSPDILKRPAIYNKE